jgi:phosphate butyryltransferase
MISDFKVLENEMRAENQRKIAVALAEDPDILTALEKARKEGFTQAILTGNKDKIVTVIKQLDLDQNHYDIVSTQGEEEAVSQAVSFVKNGDAHVLMKGLCSTAGFLRGVLDKETGLRTGKILSHLAIFESPNYHKLFMMSDAAMNIAPTLFEKIQIIENALAIMKNLGYKKPKVAIISALEKVNAEQIPSTADAAILAKMGDRGQIKNVIIDGPLAVDNALSLKSCQVKGLDSPVGGDADLCIVPNIETGNVFYKLLTIMGNSKVAGIIVGAKAPIVLTSRADSAESKYLSILSALKAS